MTSFVSIIVLRTSKYKETLILEETIFKEAIYNTSLDGVLIIDARSKITFDCNNSILQLFELNSKEQIIGTALNEWLRKDYTDKIKSLGAIGSDDESIWRGEMMFRASVYNLYSS